MLIILLVVLLLLSLGSLPAWPYSRGWGYYPSGGLGLVVVVLVVLLLLGESDTKPPSSLSSNLTPGSAEWCVQGDSGVNINEKSDSLDSDSTEISSAVLASE